MIAIMEQNLFGGNVIISRYQKRKEIGTQCKLLYGGSDKNGHYVPVKDFKN